MSATGNVNYRTFVTCVLIAPMSLARDPESRSASLLPSLGLNSMRFRNVAVAAVLAAGATLPFAGIANAQQGDRDCPDFASQADAQEALDSQPGDPERLDSDDDGIACESEFGEPTTSAAPTTTAAPAPSDDDAEEAPVDATVNQVRVVPEGGVDTGDGSTVGEPVDGAALIALAGLVTVATAAAATGLRAHRSR